METSNLKQKINSVNYRILSNIDNETFPVNYQKQISFEEENYLITRLVKSGMNWEEIRDELLKAERGEESEFSDLMIKAVQGDDYTFKDSAIPFVMGMLVILGILNVVV
tara:strand:+ start:400 stop:726 length:327 start_codon:yes stop_codon:yes gene_type:complete